MFNQLSLAGGEAICPVPIEKLGQLYRSEPDEILDKVREMPEASRVRLAVYCYGRSHMRDVGLAIATSCSEKKLEAMAGVIGQVLAVQCRAKAQTFGAGPATIAASKPRISLGGSRISGSDAAHG